MAESSPVSVPTGKLESTIITLAKSDTVFRVHPARYEPKIFNASRAADARFSPLFDNSGNVIPTLYAGSTLDCALMETVFHDVPFAKGIKTVSKDDYIGGRVFSRLELTRDLFLVDLRTIALRKLGVMRTQLIDTHKSQYTISRQWAQALHSQNPGAEGLLWTSRQDDTGSAMILFGDRLTDPPLQLVEGPTSLLIEDGSACIEVLELADRLGVLIL